MPLDPALVAETRAWLAKAVRGLAAGSHGMNAAEPLLEDVAFHAQQAVEKTLKAFLTWHSQTFRKTHNPVELGIACERIDASLAELLREAGPLTEYAWQFRYPGEPEAPSRESDDG